MARTLNETIRLCTDDYLDHINVDAPPSPAEIEAELVTIIKDACVLENQARAKGDSIKPPVRLCASQIAAIMLKLHNIVRIKCGGTNADPGYDLLAIYQYEGDNEGIYTTDENVFKQLAKQYNYSISGRELNDVMEMIMLDAPRVSSTMDKDLIAV